MQGTPSLVSALVATLGLVAALYPRLTILATLYSQAPLLREILPYLLTIAGSVGAAIAHPPEWLRTRVLGAGRAIRRWVSGHVRRSPAP